MIIKRLAKGIYLTAGLNYSKLGAELQINKQGDGMEIMDALNKKISQMKPADFPLKYLVLLDENLPDEIELPEALVINARWLGKGTPDKDLIAALDKVEKYFSQTILFTFDHDFDRFRLVNCLRNYSRVQIIDLNLISKNLRRCYGLRKKKIARSSRRIKTLLVKDLYADWRRCQSV